MKSIEDKGHKQVRVGIYWSYKGTLFATFSQSPQEANSTDISIDSTFSHWHEWQVLAENGELEKLPMELRDEYDAIDRGRVLYKNREGQFVILHGSSFSRKLKEEIIEAFHLHHEKVIDEWDEHYDPLPEDFIF